MKRLLKIYENGDLDILDLDIVKNQSFLSFNEKYINVNSIIEYPKENFRNYYIEKNISDGFITNNQEGQYKPGDLHHPTENDVTSDFINVKGWLNITIRIRFLEMNGLYNPYVGVSYFDQEKKFIESVYDDYVSQQKTGNYMKVLQLPINVNFVRITTNYHNVPGVDVQKTVEKGLNDNIKYFKSYEDMPNWVKSIESNFGIFEKGLVIKGDILKNGEIIL